MAKPLAAIAYRNRYYSIFKQEPDAAKIMDIAAKLARRGDDTLLTLAAANYTLALLEPNGRII